jgi:GT2 family glycosyltransferase
MTHFDDLSLITTMRNDAAMLAEMLRSFEASLGTVEKIVIVDDGSSRPCSLPSVSSAIRLIRNELPHGFCQASDMALRRVRTPYAFLVDADVVFEPGDFAGGYSEFKQGNWAWVSLSQTNFQGVVQRGYEQRLIPPLVFGLGGPALILWEKFHRSPVALARERIVPVEAASSTCTLVNLEAFRAVGGFDRWYWQSQTDVDLSLRLRAAGYRVGLDLGYCVKHKGAGRKSGSAPRVLDHYRSRLHLYELFYPASRFYLRPLLFVRHLFELAWFAAVALFKNEPKLQTRREMVKGVLKGYR